MEICWGKTASAETTTKSLWIHKGVPHNRIMKELEKSEKSRAARNLKRLLNRKNDSLMLLSVSFFSSFFCCLPLFRDFHSLTWSLFPFPAVFFFWKCMQKILHLYYWNAELFFTPISAPLTGCVKICHVWFFL